MRKRSSKGGGAQRSIQVHLMVNEEEAAMIRAAARKRNQTVSLTIIEAVKLLEGSLYVEEEEHDSPTVQALREIEYQLRRIGRNVNQIAHNANREMNATIEDEALRLSREQVKALALRMAEQRERAAEDPTQDMNRPEPSGDEPLDLSEPEDLGESGPFEERSAPRTKADLLREIRQRADRRTGQQEAEQRQIDPWQAQPPQRRGHGR